MENNQTTFTVSIWRACFSLLPGILFSTGFAYVMWQIVGAEERDVLFYGFILLLLIFPIMGLTVLLKGIFGKPPVIVNEEHILLHYPFHQDKKIEWQRIESISCERILGYSWSRYEVALYVYPADAVYREYDEQHKYLQEIKNGKDDAEALQAYLSAADAHKKQLTRVFLPNARVLKGGAKGVAQQLEAHLQAHRAKERTKARQKYDILF